MASHDITALLLEIGRDQAAYERLVPLVYEEMRRLARSQKFRWRDSRAPGTTSLVHEAYLKLVDQTQVDWKSRGQFFYIASRTMRSILIDNARWHRRTKREGDRRRVELDDDVLVSEQRSDELLALDEALSRLKTSDERLSRIVECRVFGGLTVAETAEALSLSPATIKRGWELARVWLYRELRAEAAT